VWIQIGYLKAKETFRKREKKTNSFFKDLDVLFGGLGILSSEKKKITFSDGNFCLNFLCDFFGHNLFVFKFLFFFTIL